MCVCVGGGGGYKRSMCKRKSKQNQIMNNKFKVLFQVHLKISSQVSELKKRTTI